jgi:glycosyltransferase involved in cell wall biosynthesis
MAASKSIRLAVIVSHPVQHFAPWHRELARRGDVDLRVFFCCDWGVKAYRDEEFGTTVQWDVPLTDGYAHEFLPLRARPTALNFRSVDNPGVGDALARFDPHVVKVFGYAYATNWRVAAWARTHRRAVMLYSDSNAAARRALWKRAAKEVVVRGFYALVDGALVVGDNNRAYHRRYGLPDERLFPAMLPIDRARLLATAGDCAAARREVRAQHGIDPEAFVVLLSGKYSARKRPMDLVRAAHAAAEQGAPIWALLVGEGAERAAMEAYLREHRVRNVTLTGFVNQAQIGRYYAAADVLAMVSDADPHPLAITEAAAFGLPCVVADRVGCVGPTDTARPGVNALVVPTGDTTKLIDAVEQLRTDPGLYRAMSAAARTIAEGQDVTVAAGALADAARALAEMGPRRRRFGRARG